MNFPKSTQSTYKHFLHIATSNDCSVCFCILRMLLMTTDYWNWRLKYTWPKILDFVSESSTSIANADKKTPFIFKVNRETCILVSYKYVG